jgi:Carboxypeptidase regulatory-like domain
MIKRCFWGIGITALLVVAMSLSAFGQGSTATSGNLSGVVTDTTGAVVQGAKVTLTGPIGSKSVTTEADGRFTLPALTPGTYSVKVEKQGFRAADIKGVEIVINRTSSVTIGLQPGSASEVVEVTASAVSVDTTSTAVGSNLSDTFYQSVPTARGVAGLFYASTGVASGGGTGSANPSISGGSGLENLYVADGVDITDTSFGGLGTYNRSYGSLGTGINLSFIKEVQVKTGGYEPQYGKSTGGIVQIVTKSGSNQFHGALTGFFAPQSFEATRRQPDDFGRHNLFGRRLHNEGYDAAAELSGYVPGLKDRLFFFGSINPSWTRNYDISPSIFGLSSLGEMSLRTNTFNYSAKLTLKLSDNHQVESSIFGDPSHTGTGANRYIVTDNASSFSKLEFGSRNWVARYNGTLSPTWLVNVSFSWMHNHFDESFADTFNGQSNWWVTDQTEADYPTVAVQRGAFVRQGVGYYENTKSDNYGFDVNTSKVARFGGEHTFGIGYKLSLPRYDPFKDRSGAHITIPTARADGSGDCIADPANCWLGQTSAFAAGQQAYVQFRLRRRASCTICPVMPIAGYATPQPVALQVYRGEFGPNDIHTEGTYHSAFVNDSWTFNKHVTANLGLRWEQQHMKGDTLSYTFTDNWSPRVGVTVDPIGDRKTKIYANYGRYNYAIPLDMAERSLSNELDWLGGYYAPGNTGGVVDMLPGNMISIVPDQAHLLTGLAGAGNAGGAFGTSSQGGFSGTGIAPGTKMQYLDEFVVGAEREIWGGVIVSARYMDRRLKRIVEDMAGLSPEAYNAGLSQVYFIANPSPTTDLFSNPVQFAYASGGTVPAGCTGAAGGFLTLDPVEDSAGNNLGAVCVNNLAANGQDGGAAVSDGIPDGFPAISRIYRAVEIEANKSFSKNWMLRGNWRIASLKGNYEGAYRNDNGQSDPSISSLYDFTAGNFNLLGDQFASGYLNTDRRHVINGFFSYVFDKTALKGLTLGTGVRIESGLPYNDLKAHPAYLNAGEIPNNGRGSLGRGPVVGGVDVKAEYAHSITERTRLRLGADLFNIANSRRQMIIDQNEDIAFGQQNVDFQKPWQWSRSNPGFQRPFYARFMVKFEF